MTQSPGIRKVSRHDTAGSTFLVPAAGGPIAMKAAWLLLATAAWAWAWVAGGTASGAQPAAAGTAARAREPAQLAFPDPPPVPPEFQNPWPAEWEAEFRRRAIHAIAAYAGTRVTANTWGENEKDGYARAMFAFLAGRKAEAAKVLQAEDAQAATDHRHTFGVDFYWCFTLKHQVRKAFYFGPSLEADYLERMLRGARVWTAEDPLGRPHPLHGRGDPRLTGWGPDARGGWVDGRDTDNLRAMRDVAIYLFAEAAGNERTRGIARNRLAAQVRMLYHAGMREWDSSNYHSHALAAWHNLYDFARDPEARLLGKAALDWLYASAALKTWRGGFGGPRLRDYGGATVPFGGNAIHPLALMFGDAPNPDPAPDRDDLYLITSAYRAPRAVVELARKNFTRPVEVLAAKPPYELWQTNRPFMPRYWETLYLGRTFQMGSLAGPGAEETWNPSVFNLMAYDTRRGVSYLGLNTTPLWEHSIKRDGDQVAQYRNLLVWIRPATPAAPFHLQLPRGLQPLVVSNTWFLTYERTWVALRTFGLGPWEEVPCESKTPETYAGERFLRAAPTGTNYVGVALEAGEAEAYSTFQQQVLEKGRLDLSGLDDGRVGLVGADGRSLTVRHNPRSDLPIVDRDGTRHEWGRHIAPYEPLGGRAPISQAWLGGTLRVEAGGEVFLQSVTRGGTVVR